MDASLRLILLWTIAAWLVMRMLAVWRHRGRKGGSHLVLLAVNLCATALALSGRVPETLFVAISVSLFAALVLVPLLLGGLARWALSRQRPRLARRLLDLSQLLQPGLSLKRELEMLRTLELVEAEGVEGAVAHGRAALEGSLDRSQRLSVIQQLVSLHLLNQQPAAAVALCEAEGALQLAVESAPICAALVLAHARLGNIEAAAQLQVVLEEGRAGRDPGAVTLVNQARLALVAYSGCRATVERLLQLRYFLPQLQQAQRRIWVGVAAAAAGDGAGAEQIWRDVESSRDADVSAGIASLRRRGVAEVSDERRAALAPLIGMIEQQVRRHRHVPWARGRYWRTAPVSAALLLAITAVYVTMRWLGADYGEAGERWLLLRYGANFSAVSLSSQPWRLVVSIFQHGDLPFHLHYLSNAVALYVLGRFTEQMFGHVRLWVIFGCAGIAGAVASAGVGHALSVGASGAIFGLMGAIVVGLIDLRGRAPEVWRKRLFVNLMVIIALQLLFGYSVPVIDNAAHVGGLVGGALVALLVGSVRAEPRPIDRLRAAVVYLLALLLLLGSAISGVQALQQDVPLARQRRGRIALSAPIHWFMLTEKEPQDFALQDPLLEVSPTLRHLVTQSLGPGADALARQARRQQRQILDQLGRVQGVEHVRQLGPEPELVGEEMIRGELLLMVEGRRVRQLNYFKRLGSRMVSLFGRVPEAAAPLYQPLLDSAVRSLSWEPAQASPAPDAATSDTVLR